MASLARIGVRQVISKLQHRVPTFSVCKYCSRLTDSEDQTRKWQLASAVCLQRYPVITSEKNETEKEFAEYLNTLEFELSLKSDYEMKKEKEEIELKEVKLDKNITKEEKKTQTTRDLEELWENELKEFQFAPRITEADKKNNVKSANRQLDRKLILIVKQKIDDEYVWMLPTSFRERDQSMREVAESALKQTCGDKVSPVFYGNAPSGFYKYLLPRKARDTTGFDGVKIFFYKAEFNKGKVLPEKSLVSDYMWVTKDELSNYLPENYHSKLSKIIIDL